MSVLSVRGLNGLLLFLSREIQCIIKVLGMLSVPYAEKKAFWVCIKDLVLLVGKLSFVLLCHMLSVLIVKLLTAWWYVFSLIQGVGAGGRARVYNTGLFGTFKHIFKSEGMRGLYRGLLPEYYKVVPGVGITFMVYESLKTLLCPPPAP